MTGANYADSAALRAEARRIGIAARRGVSGDRRIAAERSIGAHLLSVEALVQAAIVGVYVADDGEPAVTGFVQELWRREVVVAIPALVDDPDDFSMRFLEWRYDDDLVPHRYGIAIPRTQREVTPASLVVPLVGFDDRCRRIGRGAGFYDRWLANHDVVMVGAALEAQQLAEVPMETHDVALDAVVTELGVRFAVKAHR